MQRLHLDTIALIVSLSWYEAVSPKLDCELSWTVYRRCLGRGSALFQSVLHHVLRLTAAWPDAPKKRLLGRGTFAQERLTIACEPTDTSVWIRAPH